MAQRVCMCPVRLSNYELDLNPEQIPDCCDTKSSRAPPFFFFFFSSHLLYFNT